MIRHGSELSPTILVQNRSVPEASIPNEQYDVAPQNINDVARTFYVTLRTDRTQQSRK